MSDHQASEKGSESFTIVQYAPVSPGGESQASPIGSPLTGTQPEHMGSKEKFWATEANTGRQLLFKFSRTGTGEHWSEKIAAEIAGALGVPHANVELGMFDGRDISVTESLLKDGESLIHGNELLSEASSTYPTNGSNYRMQQHTLESVRNALRRAVVPPLSSAVNLDAFGMFVGYLMLDALIGNTDRHHENWAVIATGSGQSRSLALCPSYDHASSLGRELLDIKRSAKLEAKDSLRNVGAYCRKARSAFFDTAEARKAMRCIAAFDRACELAPSAASYWTGQLSKCPASFATDIVRRVPESCMSDTARRFAIEMLRNNQQILGERCR